MSYLNAEQEDHMRSLAETPPEKRSWCGWGYAGDKWCCGNDSCPGRREGKTLADRQAAQRTDSATKVGEAKP